MHQNKERFLTGAAAATVLHLLSRNTEIEAEQRSGRRERERERERGAAERESRAGACESEATPLLRLRRGTRKWRTSTKIEDGDGASERESHSCMRQKRSNQAQAGPKRCAFVALR